MSSKYTGLIWSFSVKYNKDDKTDINFIFGIYKSYMVFNLYHNKIDGIIVFYKDYTENTLNSIDKFRWDMVGYDEIREFKKNDKYLYQLFKGVGLSEGKNKTFNDVIENIDYNINGNYEENLYEKEITNQESVLKPLLKHLSITMLLPSEKCDHIYIIQTAENYALKNNIYKPGMSSQKIGGRFNNYDHHYKLFYLEMVINAEEREKQIFKLFNLCFKKEYAKEYYSGNILTMIRLLEQMKYYNFDKLFKYVENFIINNNIDNIFMVEIPQN